MPSLLELQTEFARAIVAHDERPLLTEWIVAGHGLAPEERIGVYRNNVFSNYRAVLCEVYPVVVALVGEPFFKRAADIYASTYPSRSGDLNDFGGELGDFLAGWPPATQLPYLPDVARLEWAVERVFHAAEAPALDLTTLATVPQEASSSLRFALHSASRVVRSPYPILRIWQANQIGFEGDQSVNLDAGGDAVLVIRRSATVELERLSPGELELLQALAADLTLAQAHARALEVDPALDLTALLRHHVLEGTLVAFHHDKGATA